MKYTLLPPLKWGGWYILIVELKFTPCEGESRGPLERLYWNILVTVFEPANS